MRSSKYPPMVLRFLDDSTLESVSAPLPFPPSTISERLACGHISTRMTFWSGCRWATSVPRTKLRKLLPTPPLLFHTAYRIGLHRVSFSIPLRHDPTGMRVQQGCGPPKARRCGLDKALNRAAPPSERSATR